MPQTTSATGALRSSSVLVTGATGKLGREVVDRLRAQDARIRALSRRPAGALPGVEPLAGDLTEPTTVRTALEGINTVLLLWPLLDAAPAYGLVEELTTTAPRVIYLSSTAVDDTAARQSDPIVQVHADMETMLRDAGLRPVVLRSDTLASNARGWAAQVRAGDVVTGPDIARTAVIDERDVADAALALLCAHQDDELDDAPRLLTGPEVLSRADQVDRLGAALGRPLRFETVPADVARTRMLADGRPEQLVDALIAASQHRPESRRVTDHVERLTGHPATSFEQWATDHAADFS
ncbi:SDR family oxidoreductase [Streptomyces sp. NBC_01012]|uniref:SDR family oxidoreductase n=1 Tax=Streptomyces sp. NBC_01012 TaxID=2903717 RepID=UPI00386BA796|nr:NAD(P)H-binding protein [Streptomyces sp. NBC_01012]